MLRTDIAVSRQLINAGASVKDGTRLLNALAILAFTVASWLMLVTAGGMWMFYRRWRDIPDYLDSRIASLPWADTTLSTYVALGTIACVFIIPPVIALSANAAVLGAAGREEKMALLRLLGATSTRTTRIALTTTAAQALVGLLLGTAGSIVTAPVWSHVSFQFTAIQPAEMILPWWGYATVWAVYLIVVLGAAWWGLRRVIITPLGVARRVPDKRMRATRVLLLAVVLIVVIPIARSVNPNTTGYFVVAGVLAAIIAGFSGAMPFVVQSASWALARLLRTPAAHTAARRNQMWPKRAWNRIVALTLLAFGLGWLGSMPVDDLADEPGYGNSAIILDMLTGGHIVVIIGFVTVAASTLLTQAASVYENRELDQSLIKMGTPRTFPGKVAAWETLGPLLMATLLTAILGFSFGMVMYVPEASFADHLASARTQVLILVGGYAVVAAALAGADVLRRQVTETAHTRNS